MSDVLNAVPVFVAAVEAGGFSAAAERLHLSRSAVGKTVARLEARLGVRLFHRTTRTQSLTEDGQAYYERCVKALAELKAGEAMLESGRLLVIGRLRVSMPVLFGRRCVAPVLLRLALVHPGLELSLSFNDRLVDLFEDGFDLAVRNGQLGEGAGLATRRIAHQRMTLCASPDYLAAHGSPESLPDLSRHQALVHERAGRPRTWLFPRVSGAPEEILPTSRLRFDDLDAISDAAAAGFGIAWLPCWLIHERVRSGALVTLFDGRPRLVFDSHAVWPQSPHLPLRVRLAIDALAAELPRATAL